MAHAGACTCRAGLLPSTIATTCVHRETHGCTQTLSQGQGLTAVCHRGVASAEAQRATHGSQKRLLCTRKKLPARAAKDSGEERVSVTAPGTAQAAARRGAQKLPQLTCFSRTTWHPDPWAQSPTQRPLHPSAPCDISSNPATLVRQALATECTIYRMLLGWSLLQWRHWYLNTGPSACDAGVMPLHHVPLNHTVRANCYPVTHRYCVCHAGISVQGAGYECLRASMAR